jgi:hypothetical protein
VPANLVLWANMAPAVLLHKGFVPLRQLVVAGEVKVIWATNAVSFPSLPSLSFSFLRLQATHPR